MLVRTNIPFEFPKTVIETQNDIGSNLRTFSREVSLFSLKKNKLRNCKLFLKQKQFGNNNDCMYLLV